MQLEDVTDHIKVLYPGFDIAYLYDQSSGHTKLRPDELSANNMNVAPECTVPSMRVTRLTGLGTYPTNITVGEQQNLNFVEGYVGPFWLNDADKIAMKYDKMTVQTSLKN